MTKKVDPSKEVPPTPNEIEREVIETMHHVQDMMLARPQDAKKIAYCALGMAVAWADGMGIDPVEFIRELRTIYVKPTPIVFIGSKGGST